MTPYYAVFCAFPMLPESPIEAVVDPNETRESIVKRIANGDLENVVQIDECTPGAGCRTITQEIICEASVICTISPVDKVADFNDYKHRLRVESRF